MERKKEVNKAQSLRYQMSEGALCLERNSFNLSWSYAFPLSFSGARLKTSKVDFRKIAVNVMKEERKIVLGVCFVSRHRSFLVHGLLFRNSDNYPVFYTI